MHRPLVVGTMNSELKTLEWDIFNPDRIITCGEQAILNLEIKKKSELSINPDIHHSKVPSSARSISFRKKS